MSSQDVWYVYVLEVTSMNETPRTTIHVGIAKSVESRVTQHAHGQVKATRGKSIKLLGHSPATTHTKALQFEAWLKKQRPDKKRFVADAWNRLR